MSASRDVTVLERRHAWHAIALAAGLLALLVLAPLLRAADPAVQLLAFGDWGSGTPEQKAVASAMEKYVQRHQIRLDAVLLLGDNFYVDLHDGVKDRHWRTLFEEMYDPKILAAPFYAVLGNHDYSDGKDRIQLDYALRNPDSRFKLPNLWYRVDLPPGDPIVTLIALNSNTEELSEEQWSTQTRWLETELARPRDATWVVCFAHHPLFSDSEHGDDMALQKAWGPAFKRYGVDYYLAGHDHVQEHLQLPGWSTSFLVSGGGGYETYDVNRSERARFARGEHGFVHLQLTRSRARVAFIDDSGRVSYSLERSREER